MKKIMIFAAVAALLSLSSCTKEGPKNTDNGSPVFTAGINPGTKTTVDAQDGTLAWEETDVITITDGGGNTATYYISGIDASTGKATFEYSSGDELGAGPYSAVYGTQPEEEQTYSETVPGKLPMNAYSPDNVLTFTVQCALMEINLTKEGESVKKIEVTGTPEDEEETTYTLTCTEAVDITEQKAFYIAIPAGTYTKIVITDSEDKVCTLNVKDEGIPVAVNQIIPATFGADNLNFKINVDYVVMNMGTGQSAYTRKWATKNLGATTVAGSGETCYGDYYAWGETEPYYASRTWNNSTKTWTFGPWKTNKSGGYTWTSYCGTGSFTEWSTPPYDNETKILKPEYDVATAKLGTDWRMPTSQEFKDLYDACGGSYDKDTYKSTTCGEATAFSKGVYRCNNYDGVTGVLFCDGTNKLFFPAAGRSEGKDFKSAQNFDACYWSSTWNPENTSNVTGRAFYFNFGSDTISLQDRYGCRYCGYPIRPVLN